MFMPGQGVEKEAVLTNWKIPRQQSRVIKEFISRIAYLYHWSYRQLYAAKFRHRVCRCFTFLAIVTRFFLVPACQELNERSTTSTMAEIPSPIPLPLSLSCRSGHPWQLLFEAEIKVCAAFHSNISQHHRNYFIRHLP